MLVANVHQIATAIQEAVAAHPSGDDPNTVGPAFCEALVVYAYKFVTPETAHLWLEQVRKVVACQRVLELAREVEK